MTSEYKRNAGSVVLMEKADECETNEFAINDDKNWIVNYARDKLSKKMVIQKSWIIEVQDLKDSGLANGDIIIISSSSLGCYTIYWSITLNRLFMSH